MPSGYRIAITLIVGLLVGGAASGQARDQAPVAAAACTITQARSSPSTTPATIVFVNETGGTVNVHWLAFDGSRQLFFQLAAGQIQSQATYIGHAWLVTDDAGACVGYVVADQAQMRYVIAAQASPPRAPRGKTILGTSKSDVLKGTPKSDRIYGRGGHDKLYGLAGDDLLDGGKGNDLLIGGPGNDRFRCGLGRDTARAGAGDTAATDCEVVTGLPKPPPPPPPPPQVPPQVPITPGSYKGLLEGNFIFFEVLADRTITGFRTNYIREDCDGGGYVYGPGGFGSTRYPISADGSFTFSVSYQGTIEGVPGPAMFFNEVTGRLDGTTATGTALGSSEFDYQGAHLKCSSGRRPWTASLVP
jgi:hypothetical protein